MKRFVSRVAIVTGGARGIGLASASRLASEGCAIAIVDQDTNALKRFVSDLQSLKTGTLVTGHLCDVGSRDQVQETVDQILKDHGRESVDCLINSAGITGQTGILTPDVNPKDFKAVIRVNLGGTFNFCQAVLPLMAKAEYGRICNVASIAGKDGNAKMLAYSASKAAVIGLTKVIGKEYAAHPGSITCNALAPAVILTEMVEAMPKAQVEYMTSKIPAQRCGRLEEIASTIAFICSEECSFTTGFTFDLSGGRAVY